MFSSKDVVNLLSILATFYFLRLYFPVLIEKLFEFAGRFMRYMATEQQGSQAFARIIAVDFAIAMVITILPLLFVAMLAGVVGTGFQTKFLFSSEALKPKFSRMNPLNGIKRMFSSRSFVELLKNVGKIAVILIVLYNFYQKRIVEISRLLGMDVIKSVAYILNSVVSLIFQVSLIYLVIAGADYLFQRWDYEKSIRMTKQEVKEEYKQIEGDPKIKNQIRQRQRRFAMSRMIQQVPTADVIIRNPTHYAVALKYDIDRDIAPIVIAKGTDAVALRIVAVGEQNGVHITEDIELARAIYAVADINQEVPFDLYRAVAEVLAYVYRMREHKLERIQPLIG
ncbi:MAG: flagellar biosynthesis protein FlhB [Oscillospiraceae bacterium]|nr:flagellar biosynthesis protein FlhB [Oscillospiraceae bacterium]